MMSPKKKKRKKLVEVNEQLKFKSNGFSNILLHLIKLQHKIKF